MKSQSRLSFASIFFTCIIIFFLVCMIANPANFIQTSLSGINAWAFNVLPSVLPFIFFTRALSALNVMPALTRPFAPITTKLFRTPALSIYTFTMAILSGYPVGSKMVADLYMQGQITKEEAFKMSSFCSTSGPMFIVGAVGIGMFHNSKIGYILFLSHLIGAILNGLAFRNLKIANNEKQPASHSEKTFNLSDIVTSSTLAILSVGCIITIFFIAIECFSPLLSPLPTSIRTFLEGLIEITKGCIDISTLSNTFLATTLCSFVISFGGLSTVLQSLTMLGALKMPVKLFVLQKFCHAIFSTLATVLLLFFLL